MEKNSLGRNSMRFMFYAEKRTAEFFVHYSFAHFPTPSRFPGWKAPVWPNWQFIGILANFQNLCAAINLPKYLTFLSNFCEVFNFSSEIILGYFLDIWQLFTGHTGRRQHLKLSLGPQWAFVYVHFLTFKFTKFDEKYSILTSLSFLVTLSSFFF